MRVVAVCLAGVPVERLEDYAAALTVLVQRLQVRMAVLPAHTSFLLSLACANLGEVRDFSAGLRLFMEQSREWNHRYLQLHSGLAKQNEVYLVAGTTVEEADGLLYHTAYCFGPDGEICGKQRQTHLSREERALGLSRGDELHLFDLAGMRAGLAVGTDALHPEVSRIFALQGVDVVAHCGALDAARGRVVQQAGMWAQVQQNQFWAVEAQLKRNISERTFGAECAVIGPCEATPGFTGYLDRSDDQKPFAVAELVDTDRHRIRADYPLLQLRRAEVYRGSLPELYREESRLGPARVLSGQGKEEV